MVDCRLNRNKGIHRCKVLKSIQNKSKKNLSWFHAKAKFPRLSGRGDADKDKVKNARDCRPFNKKKQHIIVTENGVKTIYATPGEYNAFKYIRYGRNLGLNPQDTQKELTKKGLTGKEIRTGALLFNEWKNGSLIHVEDSDMFRVKEKLRIDYEPELGFSSGSSSIYNEDLVKEARRKVEARRGY